MSRGILNPRAGKQLLGTRGAFGTTPEISTEEIEAVETSLVIIEAKARWCANRCLIAVNCAAGKLGRHSTLYMPIHQFAEVLPYIAKGERHFLLLFQRRPALCSHK